MWALQRLRKLLTAPGSLALLPSLLTGPSALTDVRKEESGAVPKSTPGTAIVPQSGEEKGEHRYDPTFVFVRP